MKESRDKHSELKNSSGRSTEADEIGGKPLSRETIPERHEEIAEKESYGKTLYSFVRALMADFILHFLTGTICPSPRAYRKYSTKGSRNLPAMAGIHSFARTVCVAFTVNSKRKFSSGGCA